MGNFREDLRTFMIVSGWIILRMRNISDKICTENQNARFLLFSFR